MKYNNLEKSSWENYFNKISKHTHDQQMRVEIAFPDFGDQVSEEWVPFDGVSYDPKDETLHVHAAEISDHTIFHPREIVIGKNDDGAVSTINVKDAEDTVQIIQFRKPQILN